jgi:hypothetical protein
VRLAAVCRAVVGVYAGVLARAAVRLLLCVRASEEGCTATASVRGTGGATWTTSSREALSAELFVRLQHTLVGRGLASLSDAVFSAVQKAAAMDPSWAQLSVYDPDSPPESSVQRPVPLSSVLALVRHVRREMESQDDDLSFLPFARCSAPPASCLSSPLESDSSRRISLLSRSDLGVLDGEPTKAEPTVSRASAEEIKLAESLVDMVWDVMDSPLFAQACRPLLEHSFSRLEGIIHSAVADSSSSGSASSADLEAPFFKFARTLTKLTDAEALLGVSAPIGASGHRSDAMIAALGKRVFVERTGATGAVAPTSSVSTDADSATMQRVLARLLKSQEEAGRHEGDA